MIGEILGILSFLKKVWEAIGILLGFIKKVEHEGVVKEINDAVKVIVPERGEEDRRDATKDLQDRFNKHV